VKVIACLGDSLTLGGTGAELHSWETLANLGALYPSIQLANFGKAGDTSSGMAARWAANISGRGYDGLQIWCAINDVTADVSGASSWANIEPVIDAAIAQGLHVGLVITPPFGASVDWSSGRQTQKDALAALMRAKAGVAFVLDLTLPRGAGGLANPSVPLNLADQDNYGDGKHLSETGNVDTAVLIAAKWAAVFAGVSSDFVEAVTLPIANAGQYAIKRGDLRPSIRMALKSRDGSPLPLPAGATVQFRMRAAGAAPGTLKVNAAAVIEDRFSAIVRYDWQGSDTDTAGYFLGEFRRVLSGGQETVPGDSFIGLQVIDPA
jgi:hypothetical protein